MYQLNKDAFMGVVWNGGSYVFSQIVSLVVKLFLVRLLLPEEFGVAGMAYIIISSLSMLNLPRTGSAFVRDKESEPVKAKNTLFYMSAASVLVVATISFFLAPYGTLFFGNKITDPQSLNTLLWMFRFVALIHLTSVIDCVSSKILAKELKFKQDVIASGAGTVAYGISAITLAYIGFGAWSIILAQFSSAMVNRCLSFYFAPFFPSLVFEWEIAKKYFNFAKNHFVNSIMSMIINNGDDTIVGRLLGTAALGFYGLGQHFAGIVVSVVSGVIEGVAFPVLSKLQDDRIAYKRAFFKIFRLKNLLGIPSIAGAVVLAPEITKLVLGEKWLPIVPVFYILSAASFLNHLTALAGPVFNSLNKSHIPRNNKIIQFVFFIVLVYPFTKMWGLVGICLVMAIFPLVSIFYLAPLLAKEIPEFYPTNLRILSKIIFSTLVMMAVVYFAKKMVPVHLFWLFALVLLGVIVYFALMWVFDKDELRWDFQEGWGILKEKFSFLRRF